MMKQTAAVRAIVALQFLTLLATAHGASKVQVLSDFETPDDLRMWDFKSGTAALSDQHATHGQHSVKIPLNEYMNAFRLPHDWSGFDSFDIDIFVEGDAPVVGNLLIADTAWQKSGGSYWNRHNGGFTLAPGATTLSIPVNGLFRGESGSRNNDLKSNIDPTQIIRVDIGFESKGKVGAIYIDNIRLTKEARPEGVLAFDFGPENQVLAPGFTAIGPSSVIGKNGATAGFRHPMSAARSRDDGFPTRLYQDFVPLEGEQFIVDVPNGLYHVWLMFDDLGYWGGEQASFRTRHVTANGVDAWKEDRGAAGPANYLYQFENVEPKPGDSVWELYMRQLFQPHTFDAQVKDKRLVLQFDADGPNACKVAAVIVYPDARKVEAEQWIGEVEQRNKKEFESRAIFLGPKAKPLDVPATAKAAGYWLGYPTLEDEVTFVDAPGPSDRKLSRQAARGERVSCTFALRPLKDYSAGPVTLIAGDLKGPAGVIPASEIDLRYVQHALHRTFNNIAYTIGPETLRLVEGSALRLNQDLTRQFWITVHVPEKAAAGEYTGEVALTAGALHLTLPLHITVLPYALDEPEFTMAFYGTDVPRVVQEAKGDDAWRELLKVLRDNGMNTVSGGPGIAFSGLDADGKPKLDFTACDHYVKLVQEAGFTKELDGYGDLGRVIGLHDGYVIGQTGHDWEKKTGKPFGELLKIVYGAVQEHAKQAGWPVLRLGFVDEPRVIDVAQKQLELMKEYESAVPFVNTGGSYSVQWKEDPFEKVMQETFKTLHWSALNSHTQIDLDKAKEFGRQLLIYNQGTSRYSFGAYQWAEMHKGVKGRLQWHLLALHGYQFFDLDGREPDTAAINWGKSGIVPTLRLHQCREGADDLRYAVTLWNLCEKNPAAPAAKEARAWLEDISAKIPVGKNDPPAGFMTDEAFRAGCVERIQRMGVGR